MKEDLRLSAYLAGPGKEKEYRRYAIEKYGDKMLLKDPMVITRDQVLDEVGENCFKTFIIRRDKKMINSCDVVIAYLPYITYGTTFEMAHAYDHGIPVYGIDPTGELRKDVWLSFHVDQFFDSIDECFQWCLRCQL
jgi:nucleoside 2-deoxyribosyltransferase